VRILLDASLPRRLARLLPEHDIRTGAAMGWAGIRNSERLRLAAAGFDALLRALQAPTPRQLVRAGRRAARVHSPAKLSRAADFKQL
jgi:hypothetical protein